MGALHKNRKGVPAEIKTAKLKKGKHVSVYKDRLIIMKWRNKKVICLISITHDKMVPTRVQGQDMQKPEVVTDYNSGMGGVNVSDAYLPSYRSTRKGLTKYYQKYFCVLSDICCLNSYVLHIKRKAIAFPGTNFK
jgi:hypothetical protein